MRTIAIAAGGDSSEYEISVKSAEQVSRILSSRYEVYIILIRGINWYWEDPKGRYHNIDKNDFTLVTDEVQGIVRIYLKYDENKKPAISGLRRISRPGYRKYTDVDKIPRVLNGMGIAILSTPKGLLVDRQAKKDHVGGEVLCYVW